MQKTTCYFQSVIIILLFFFCSCKKDTEREQDNTNSSASLNSGRAGITFNTNDNFGGSKTFKVKNTSRTTATSQAVGSSKRHIVLEAEETYGSLADTRKATVYITVPVPTTLPVTIDLAIPLSSVPSAQVELYESIAGGMFGNTYRSVSGQLRITKLTAAEIEGSFSGSASSTIPQGYTVTNGTLAGKF